MGHDDPHDVLVDGQTLKRIEIPAAWVRRDVIGDRSRIWILDEVIRRATSLGDVRFATHEGSAEWLLHQN